MAKTNNLKLVGNKYNSASPTTSIDQTVVLGKGTMSFKPSTDANKTFIYTNDLNKVLAMISIPVYSFMEYLAASVSGTGSYNFPTTDTELTNLVNTIKSDLASVLAAASVASATKATNDGNGNNIANTYETKTGATNKVNTLANTIASTYATKTEVSNTYETKSNVTTKANAAEANAKNYANAKDVDTLNAAKDYTDELKTKLLNGQVQPMIAESAGTASALTYPMYHHKCFGGVEFVNDAIFTVKFDYVAPWSDNLENARLVIRAGGQDVTLTCFAALAYVYGARYGVVGTKSKVKIPVSAVLYDALEISQYTELFPDYIEVEFTNANYGATVKLYCHKLTKSLTSNNIQYVVDNYKKIILTGYPIYNSFNGNVGDDEIVVRIG